MSSRCRLGVRLVYRRRWAKADCTVLHRDGRRTRCLKWASRCGEWRRSRLSQRCLATPRLLVNNDGAFFYSLTWYFTIFAEETRIVDLGGYFHVLFRQLAV